MKKIKILVASILFGSFSYGQAPTGNPPNPSTVPNNANSAWYRGGNNPIGTAGTNNIFGTMWNSPIYTYTNGIARGIRNGDRFPTINGFTNVNTSGFMGLGPNSIGNGHPSGLWTDIGPFSLLHLNGVTTLGDFVWAGGYRPWMRTGITFSDQTDLGYIGIRSVLPANNINEFVINWSNDPSVGQWGPDDMVFRFSAGTASGASTINTSNLQTNKDLDGLHIARFAGTGEFGLGNTFGAGNSIYVRPASLMHLSLSNMRSVWSQWTNRRIGVNSGTRETASDGLRIGIKGHPQNKKNGNALIYNQERRHLLFSTNRTTASANFNSGNTGERMRITNIGAPTNLATGGYGQYNPAGLNGNVTRVSISRNPAIPVTRPLSLLHLGYNAGLVGSGTTDGWRSWMDIGTFTSNGTDNMYIGLKQEAGAFPLNDKNDAVINWGDNDGTNPLNGPDNLRFIFTSTQTSTVPANFPGTSQNGLEVARYTPKLASTLAAPNYGMMGIGDWTTAFNTLPANVIDAKLDIDGDLRIREVTQVDSLTRVLVIDSNDHNRVHWRDVSTLGGVACWDLNNNGIQDPNEDINGDNNWDALDCQGAVGPQGPIGPQGPAGSGVLANNGTTIFGTNTVQLGQNVGAAGNPGQLLNNREIPLNGKNIYFTGASTTTNNNRFFIGRLSELSVPPGGHGGKLQVYHLSNTGRRTAISGTTDGSNQPDQSYGVTGISANGIRQNIGVRGDGVNGGTNAAGDGNIGVYGEASGTGSTNTGVVGVSTSTTSTYNYGGHFNATSFGGPPTTVIDIRGVNANAQGSAPVPNVYGIVAKATTGINTYGVYGTASGGTSGNWAGWFQDGNVWVKNTLFANNGGFTTSDVMFKQNIQPLTNARSIITQLAPRTYNLDSANFSQFGFDTKQHMGLVAQEVEQILPNLVKSTIMPAQYDTNGVQTSAAVSYKALEYHQFIPLLIAGMKEQQSLIDSLIDEVTVLSRCIEDANICNTHSRVIDNEDEGKVIQLENLNAIILDQNLPNPFAEKTSINYTIPDDVVEAQLLFYDMNGRIIKQVNITERGEGKLTVYGENLQNGIYTYSLIADGKLIATKKMVKQ